MADLWVVVHIPRTGGQSLQEILHPHASVFYLDSVDDPVGAGYTRRILCNQRAQMERNIDILTSIEREKEPVVVMGHMVCTKYEYVFPYAKHIVFFRHPVARLASHYKYWHKRPDFADHLCLDVIDGRMSFEEFALHPEIRNAQSRYVCNKKLDSFWGIGITEEFTRSLCLLGEMTGLVFSEVNINKAAGEVVIDTETQAMIERFHQEDMDLYTEAVELFHERCGVYGV